MRQHYRIALTCGSADAIIGSELDQARVILTRLA
jgi:hypothetical protein